MDQDPAGLQGNRVAAGRGGREVWVRRLAGGDRALLFFNRGRRQVTMRFFVRRLGLAPARTYRARDVWTHRTLGRNWSGILEVREDHRLVTSGPYRWVRHPMYSVFFIFCFAQLVISANALVGMIGLSTLSYFYLRRVHDEEAMMIEQFGDAYRQYMGRTGRLVPRLASRAA